MWGVGINLIREVRLMKYVPDLTGRFGGKAVSRLFRASLKFWCTLCATQQRTNVVLKFIEGLLQWH